MDFLFRKFGIRSNIVCFLETWLSGLFIFGAVSHSSTVLPLSSSLLSKLMRASSVGMFWLA